MYARKKVSPIDTTRRVSVASMYKTPLSSILQTPSSSSSSSSSSSIPIPIPMSEEKCISDGITLGNVKLDYPFWCNEPDENSDNWTPKQKNFVKFRSQKYKEYKKVCNDSDTLDEKTQKLVLEILIDFIKRNPEYQKLVKLEDYISDYIKNAEACIKKRNYYTEELIRPKKRDKGHETYIDLVEKTKNKYTKWYDELKTLDKNLSKNIVLTEDSSISSSSRNETSTDTDSDIISNVSEWQEVPQRRRRKN